MFCMMETDTDYGLNWPSTQADTIAVVECSPTCMLKSCICVSSAYICNVASATRLCDSDSIWQSIDVANCQSAAYLSLLYKVRI